MNRVQRRAAQVAERRAKATGEWGEWRHHNFPAGSVGTGWCAQITYAASNSLYSVLIRDLPTGVTHLAIRTISQLEPPWRDLQRIKNELAGEDRFAVQVCPPESRLIDEADMYHLWVMPGGFEPGFGLHRLDERGRS